jgi:transcriptional regulator with XRE-family HTH domain
MNRRDVGKMFKDCRKYMGLNQLQLSKVLGCSQSRISKIEMGRLEPSAIELGQVLHKMTGVDVWKILEIQLKGPAEEPKE